MRLPLAKSALGEQTKESMNKKETLLHVPLAANRCATGSHSRRSSVATNTANHPTKWWFCCWPDCSHVPETSATVSIGVNTLRSFSLSTNCFVFPNTPHRYIQAGALFCQVKSTISTLFFFHGRHNDRPRLKKNTHHRLRIPRGLASKRKRKRVVGHEARALRPTL